MPSFHDVPRGPPDHMFILKQDYDGDITPDKVDLGAGVLRDENGICYEFPAVQQAKVTLELRKLGHDVSIRLPLPILHLTDFG
jgi:aspartate aminotransferase, cytoplasmic